jgi:hypothetical protein
LFHYQGPLQRREQDFRDDGHSFRQSLGSQTWLPFGKVLDEGVVQKAIQTQHKAAPGKKPLQKAAAQKKGQKKPLQHAARKAAKPAKRSVA